MKQCDCLVDQIPVGTIFKNYVGTFFIVIDYNKCQCIIGYRDYRKGDIMPITNTVNQIPLLYILSKEEADFLKLELL